MIRGLQLAMDLVHADKGVIAVKAIHGNAVRALQQAMADDERLALHFLPNVYPVGEERGRRPGSPGGRSSMRAACRRKPAPSSSTSKRSSAWLKPSMTRNRSSIKT